MPQVHRTRTQESSTSWWSSSQSTRSRWSGTRSTRSWWSTSQSTQSGGSDTQSTGKKGTKIHQLVKPFLKFLYHKRALTFLTNAAATPLSDVDLEVHMGYLRWVSMSLPRWSVSHCDVTHSSDAVASKTKIAILEHLALRARFVDQAQALCTEDKLQQMRFILSSKDPIVLARVLDVLEAIAAHEALNGAVIESRVYAQLAARSWSVHICYRP
jgi:hypothetical protein